MKMKPNIGTMNALIRIALGFTMLAWATAKLSKRPRRQSYLILAFLGAMRVGEGILKYCPLTDLWENRSDYMNNQDQKKDQNKSDRKENLDIPGQILNALSSNDGQNAEQKSDSHSHGAQKQHSSARQEGSAYKGRQKGSRQQNSDLTEEDFPL